jgi:hypothetical protein
MQFYRAAAAVVATMGLAFAGAASASANTTAPESYPTPETVTIEGREFGPVDGLEVVVEQFEIESGNGPVGEVFGTTPAPGTITPFATWGTSYATSTETLQLKYTGRAKAAANVYSGKRIIQVCFWYTRDSKVVAGKICSNASSDGGWRAGVEVSKSVWDSLVPNAPKTIFNISTARIDPTIH